jgi:saccharopine dehydrogenase (NADP+, L-glutamate forming)
LFREKKIVNILNEGPFEMYANRDSLLYMDVYGLSKIPNIIRGTLRAVGFCEAWDALIQIGLTDADFPILDSGNITYHELLDAYVDQYNGGTLRERVAQLLNKPANSLVMDQLEWLGLFRKIKIKHNFATPALILENLLREKWALQPEDKDMIIMQHEVEYRKEGKKFLKISSMKLQGEDSQDTAMSKTVGLPLGIFVKLVLEGKISARGVQIPVMREVYEPVLRELEEDYSVVFNEKLIEL